MNTIEYKGVTYRPSQFWPLVRALMHNGYTVEMRCVTNPGFEYTRYVMKSSACGYVQSSTPFYALGKLVDEIKKAGAK